MADEDIREAFATLKNIDESVAPAFEMPRGSRGSRWQWRPGVISTVGVSALLALIFLTHPVSTESPAVPQIVSTDPFEDCSEAISRELFAAASLNSVTRSDFLLDFDTTLADTEK